MRQKLFSCLMILVVCYLIVGTIVELAYGQAGTNTAAGITCPATGSSIQVQPFTASRMSYSIINDSAVDVRIGFLSTGTATLDDTNSFILKAGQPVADSIPGIYYGRLVCMSTTAVAQVIHTTQATR